MKSVVKECTCEAIVVFSLATRRHEMRWMKLEMGHHWPARASVVLATITIRKPTAIFSLVVKH